MQDLVEIVSSRLKSRGWMLATAESCTGGLLSAAITDKPGASAIFDRGFITYTNTAKTEMLGVPSEILATHGAVSAECAEAMAKGALQNSKTDIAVSITGIAGPDGGTQDKPIGLVFIGYALSNGIAGSSEHRLNGSRHKIRESAVQYALKKILELIE